MTERTTPKKSAQNLCRVCAREFNDSKKNKLSLFSGNLAITLAKVVDEKVEFGDGLPSYVCSTCGRRIRRCRGADGPDGNVDVHNAAFSQVRELYSKSVTLFRKKRENVSTNYSPSKPHELGHERKRSLFSAKATNNGSCARSLRMAMSVSQSLAVAPLLVPRNVDSEGPASHTHRSKIPVPVVQSSPWPASSPSTLASVLSRSVPLEQARQSRGARASHPGERHPLSRYIS